MKATTILSVIAGVVSVGFLTSFAQEREGETLQEPQGDAPSDVESQTRTETETTRGQREGAEVKPEADREGVTALEALRRVSVKFGGKAVSHIAEMKGGRGQSQPESWKIAAVDLSNPFLLRTYRVDRRGVADLGENRAFYPDNPPPGIIATAKLAVGSYDAFLALDKAAASAKIGFDHVHYRLRCRELSSEPVWALTAMNMDGRPVAFVDVSAHTGKVLRTVWLRRSGTRSVPTVEDSVLKKALREKK